MKQEDGSIDYEYLRVIDICDYLIEHSTMTKEDITKFLRTKGAEVISQNMPETRSNAELMIKIVLEDI
jgi:hypothetical protein